MAQLESQARAADKAEQIQQVLAAEQELRTQHVADFPLSQRGFAPDAQPSDIESIERVGRRRVMANIGWFARERRAYAQTEARQRAVAVANEQFAKALDDAERLQAAYDTYWNGLCAHDLETVVGAVDDAFADNAWESTCVDAGTDHDSGRRYVSCVVMFGPSEMVPDRTVATTPTGRPSLRKRSKTDINNVYVAALGSTVLATVKEALAVAPAADEIRILVVRAEDASTVAAATAGYSAIYFGVFERSKMELLNWRAIDPVEQLLQAPGAELLRKGTARTVTALSEATQGRMAQVLHAFAESADEDWDRSTDTASRVPPGSPEPSSWAPPASVVGRLLDERPEARPPRSAQGLRDWWWSGTRAQRWSAAIGAPVVLLLIMGSGSALGSNTPVQAGPLPTITSTTTERSRAPTTSANRTPTPAPTQLATVVTIVDGDTIVVSRNGTSTTVRLIGIDAPEAAGSAAGLQCWAVESAAFATQTLLQQQVRLVADSSQGTVDSMGQTLAYILLPDGRDFSVLSVGAGYARNYTLRTPAAKIGEIGAAEQVARTAGAGLWGAPCNGGVAFPVPVAAPLPPPAPEPPPAPDPGPVVDPRFGTCREANAAGYGPYYAGVDPEYDWYIDRDHDGIDCER